MSIRYHVEVTVLDPGICSSSLSTWANIRCGVCIDWQFFTKSNFPLLVEHNMRVLYIYFDTFSNQFENVLI